MIIEPKNALQKPLTLNPGTKYAVNISNNALITNAKTPKVTTLNGNVIQFKIGLIETLIIPITIAATIAAGTLLTVIPGRIHAVNKTIRVKISHWIRR